MSVVIKIVTGVYVYNEGYAEVKPQIADADIVWHTL